MIGRPLAAMIGVRHAIKGMIGGARRIFRGAAGQQLRGGVSALKRRQFKSARKGFTQAARIAGRESGVSAHLGRHGKKYTAGAGLAGGYTAGRYRQKRRQMRGIHRRGDLGPGR